MQTHKPKREDFIPEGAEERSDLESDAVAYLFENRGRPCAKLFVGKRARHEWHYWFKTPEARDKRIEEGFRDRRRTLASKTRYQPSNAGIEVGHIFVASWGYDQTNVDFWQVTKLVGKSMAEVRPIGSVDASSENEAPMTEHVVPYADHFIGPARRVRISNSGFNPESFIHARLWDGKPCYASHYA
ncbi:hypothetical protein [Martelella soudanensis]|uniref:hypothetical protein n=1 Tax=unclassified Martelella TaxID=2629616 RepID=UPI0015DE4D4C|nr:MULTISPECIES: hypothetical protein [unclassified Martelella]